MIIILSKQHNVIGWSPYHGAKAQENLPCPKKNDVALSARNIGVLCESTQGRNNSLKKYAGM